MASLVPSQALCRHIKSANPTPIPFTTASRDKQWIPLQERSGAVIGSQAYVTAHLVGHVVSVPSRHV